MVRLKKYMKQVANSDVLMEQIESGSLTAQEYQDNL